MTSKSPDGLEEFGQAMIYGVYDNALGVEQMIMTRGVARLNPDPRQVGYQALTAQEADVLRRFVVEAVNTTFAKCLQFFVRHNIALPYKSEYGTTVDVAQLSDDLSAEPFSDSGWIARFSEYPHGIPPSTHNPT